MSLTKNVGKTDRTIRLGVAGLLVLLGIWVHQPILSVIGLVLLVTGATGFCLAYLPFKINTTKDDQD